MNEKGTAFFIPLGAKAVQKRKSGTGSDDYVLTEKLELATSKLQKLEEQFESVQVNLGRLQLNSFKPVSTEEFQAMSRTVSKRLDRIEIKTDIECATKEFVLALKQVPNGVLQNAEALKHLLAAFQNVYVQMNVVRRETVQLKDNLEKTKLENTLNATKMYEEFSAAVTENKVHLADRSQAMECYDVLNNLPSKDKIRYGTVLTNSGSRNPPPPRKPTSVEIAAILSTISSLQGHGGLARLANLESAFTRLEKDIAREFAKANNARLELFAAQVRASCVTAKVNDFVGGDLGDGSLNSYGVKNSKLVTLPAKQQYAANIGELLLITEYVQDIITTVQQLSGVVTADRERIAAMEQTFGPSSALTSRRLNVLESSLNEVRSSYSGIKVAQSAFRGGYDQLARSVTGLHTKVMEFEMELAARDHDLPKLLFDGPSSSMDVSTGSLNSSQPLSGYQKATKSFGTGIVTLVEKMERVANVINNQITTISPKINISDPKSFLVADEEVDSNVQDASVEALIRAAASAGDVTPNNFMETARKAQEQRRKKVLSSGIATAQHNSRLLAEVKRSIKPNPSDTTTPIHPTSPQVMVSSPPSESVVPRVETDLPAIAPSGLGVDPPSNVLSVKRRVQFGEGINDRSSINVVSSPSPVVTNDDGVSPAFLVGTEEESFDDVDTNPVRRVAVRRKTKSGGAASSPSRPNKFNRPQRAHTDSADVNVEGASSGWDETISSWFS